VTGFAAAPLGVLCTNAYTVLRSGNRCYTMPCCRVPQRTPTSLLAHTASSTHVYTATPHLQVIQLEQCAAHSLIKACHHVACCPQLHLAVQPQPHRQHITAVQAHTGSQVTCRWQQVKLCAIRHFEVNRLPEPLKGVLTASHETVHRQRITAVQAHARGQIACSWQQRSAA
jgi:hypothetical protein